MSKRVTRGGLLVIMAFLVPVIVELRTLAGLFGFALSTTQYLVVSTLLVLVVLGVVAVWNLRVADAGATGSEGV